MEGLATAPKQPHTVEAMTLGVPGTEMSRQSIAFAGALAGRGVVRGDRVAIVTPEHRGLPQDAAATAATGR